VPEEVAPGKQSGIGPDFSGLGKDQVSLIQMARRRLRW
jgi:hypothetical protein